MASVTKHLNFAVTTSTSYEQPYVVAKRFATLDHLTGGRFGWNIVTSWKPAASRAVSLFSNVDIIDELTPFQRLVFLTLSMTSVMTMLMNISGFCTSM